MSDDQDLRKEMNENNRKIRVLEGELQHKLDMFGDVLAKKHNYKKHRGIEAVRWFLVEKYKWTPATVKALNFDDLSFLLEEERENYTSPDKAKLYVG